MSEVNSLPIPFNEEALVAQTDEALTWRQRLASGLGRAAAYGAMIAGGVGAALGVGVSPAQAAEGPSCYGDYCSGQYANETGCDRDARTLLSQPIMAKVTDIEASTSDGFHTNTHRKEVGIMEVRGSDDCGTVWTRVKLHVPSHIVSVSTIQAETGYTQTHVAQRDNGRDEVTGNFFTPQIYTHNMESQGKIFIHGVDKEDSYTHWVPGLRNN